MSESPQQTHVHVHHPPSNGLGTAAGICSILGLVSCGILCPIGFVLGLISMGKEPKGMALTGVILGAVGSFIYLIVFIFFGGALLVMCGGCIGFSNLAAGAIEQRNASRPAAEAIIEYYDENDVLPIASDAEQLLIGFTYEGNSFRYESTIGESFVIQHPGDDGAWDTEDDWETSWNATLDNIDPWDVSDPAQDSDPISPTP